MELAQYQLQTFPTLILGLRSPVLGRVARKHVINVKRFEHFPYLCEGSIACFQGLMDSLHNVKICNSGGKGDLIVGVEVG